MIPWIPLLSLKPLEDFSPEEYKNYTRSLQQQKKTKPIKLKLPFTIGRTKKGSIQIRVNRKPKWLSDIEMKSISREYSIPLNELFLRLKKSKIKISTLEDELKIKLEVSEIPF